MKRIILLLLLPLLCHVVLGQQKAEAEKLVSEGIVFHDKGSFDAAIAKYDAALMLDEDNLLALAEKAMTSVSLRKNNDAILLCQKAIEKHAGDPLLHSVYVTYGNAYDGLMMADKSIEVYDEGIKYFPNDYQLHFNKGITLSGLRKYDEAINCFQKSMSLKPLHPGSHNALGKMLQIKNNRVPAILACSRFLIIEPEGARAKENFASLQELMNGNVQKTGKGAITISIDADMLGDSSANGKVKENSFFATEMILAMSAALDFEKKGKEKSEVQRFIKKFDDFCAALAQTKKDNHGFYWAYYAPYFIEMKENKLIETFGYLAFASTGDRKVNKWLETHGREISEFYKWSKAYDWKAK